MAESDEFNIDDDLIEDTPPDSDSAQSVDSQASTKSKRPLIIGISIVLIIGISVTTYIMLNRDTKPKRPMLNTVQPSSAIKSQPINQVPTKRKKRKKVKYKELFSQLAGEQTAQVLKELSFANIAFKTEQRGSKFTVFVDESEIDHARNLLAIKGLPSGGIKGYALLDDAQTLGVTEFDKRVRFLRALSGELEKAIMQFEMVDDAKVQIVLPEQRLFAVTQPPVTSSILIRRIPGVTLTDDVVFSIIQLVSNAVENLQPENVSVIDTSGFVLSEGIFERIAARKEGEKVTQPKPLNVEDEPEEIAPTSREDAMGQPVVPNYQVLSEWFDLKWQFEKTLVQKATKQLMGVLPLGSYKVAVSSDIGPIENGQIVDVRRLTISVVVDQSNDEVYLDQQIKQEVFNTIAGAIGYVKGRDSIILSRADFNLLNSQEKRDIEKMVGLKKWNWKIATWIALGLIGLLGILGVIYRIKNRSKSSEENLISPSSTKENDSFSDLQEEIEVEKHIETLHTLANTNPKKIADFIVSCMPTEPPAAATDDDEFIDPDEEETTDTLPDETDNDLSDFQDDGDVLFDDDDEFEQDVFSESPELQEEVAS